MPWVPLKTFEIDIEELNEDVVDAIRDVKRVIETVELKDLEPSDVLVDADPEYRAAYFRFRHRTAGYVIELRHGDGYTYALLPFGEYHGFVDHPFGEFALAVLTGGFVRLTRQRGGVEVETRWRWRDDAGAWHEIGRNVVWSRVWYLARPSMTEHFDAETVDFR